MKCVVGLQEYIVTGWPLTADTASMAQTVSQWVRTSTKSEGLGRDAADAVKAAAFNLFISSIK